MPTSLIASATADAPTHTPPPPPTLDQALKSSQASSSSAASSGGSAAAASPSCNAKVAARAHRLRLRRCRTVGTSSGGVSSSTASAGSPAASFTSASSGGSARFRHVLNDLSRDLSPTRVRNLFRRGLSSSPPVPRSRGQQGQLGQLGQLGQQQSCCYVQMRKSQHYRLGEWRRELMADELGAIGREELDKLSTEARLTQEQLVALWRRKPSGGPQGVHGAADGPQRLSRWGRAAHAAVRSARGLGAGSEDEAGGEGRPRSTLGWRRGSDGSTCGRRRAGSPRRGSVGSIFAGLRGSVSALLAHSKSSGDQQRIATLGHSDGRSASSGESSSRAGASSRSRNGSPVARNGSPLAGRGAQSEGGSPAPSSPGNRSPASRAIAGQQRARVRWVSAARRASSSPPGSVPALSSASSLPQLTSQRSSALVLDMQRRTRATGVVNFADMRALHRQGSSIQHGMLIYMPASPRLADNCSPASPADTLARQGSSGKTLSSAESVETIPVALPSGASSVANLASLDSTAWSGGAWAFVAEAPPGASCCRGGVGQEPAWATNLLSTIETERESTAREGTGRESAEVDVSAHATPSGGRSGAGTRPTGGAPDGAPTGAGAE